MKDVLEKNPSLYLDSNTLDCAEGPKIFHVRPAVPALRAEEENPPPKSESTRRYLYGTDVFKLHSRPGAEKIIYLDFDGHNLTDSVWSPSSYLYAPACDWDGDPSSFSEAEAGNIKLIWSYVAEDFAPFDVDVTTELLSPGLITRSGSTDTVYGTRVVIAPGIASKVCGRLRNCGGVAYLGIYAETSDYYKPALCFPDMLGSGHVKYVAECISHEVGHNLNLLHHGTSSTEYYKGQGTGETGWAPIMGDGDSKNLVQWSKGEYQDANRLQDDLEMISKYIRYRTDDVGDNITSATPLSLVNCAFSASGVIGKTGEKDVFSLATGTGSVTAQVTFANSASTNLDALLELLNSSGAVLATANPLDTLATGLHSYWVPSAGTYYLRVSGVGKEDPKSTGYSNYGSLGQYTISGTAPSCDPSTTAAPLVWDFSGLDYSTDSGRSAWWNKVNAVGAVSYIHAARSRYACNDQWGPHSSWSGYGHGVINFPLPSAYDTVTVEFGNEHCTDFVFAELSSSQKYWYWDPADYTLAAASHYAGYSRRVQVTTRYMPGDWIRIREWWSVISPDLKFSFSNSCWHQCPTRCQAGKYSTPTAFTTVCTSCVAGKYNPVSGSSKCTDCTAGKYSTTTGANFSSICIVCGAGKYQANAGSSVCIDCEAGKFSVVVGATTPSTCSGTTYLVKTVKKSKMTSSLDPVENWSHSQVAKWIEDCANKNNFPITAEQVQKFIDEEIDGKALKLLTNEDLKEEFHFKLGPRRLLLEAIQNL